MERYKIGLTAFLKSIGSSNVAISKRFDMNSRQVLGDIIKQDTCQIEVEGSTATIVRTYQKMKMTRAEQERIQKAYDWEQKRIRKEKRDQYNAD